MHMLIIKLKYWPLSKHSDDSDILNQFKIKTL